MLPLRCLYGWAQSSVRWWSFCRCNSPPQQGKERLERCWNDCFASGLLHGVWSWPVATGRSDVRSFKETQGATGRVYLSIFIHWNEKHGYLVQCSSSIRIRSDTSKRTTPDHARKDKRQITPRCTATRQSRALVYSVVPVSCRAVPNQSHFDDCT